MFPQPDSSYIFDNIERYMKLFGKEKTEKLRISVGGYALRRTRDGAFWGTSDGSAYLLFVDENVAEATKRAIDSDGSWEVICIGGLWLDKLPAKSA